MKNARIAFVSYPDASHVNSMRPIVRTLARRGHYITYATSERFAPRLEESGAKVLVGLPFSPFSPEAWSESIFRMAQRTLDDADSFYTQKPDLMIYDFLSLAGPVLAQRWSIPAMQMTPHFAYEACSFHLQIRSERMREFYRRFGKDCDSFLRSHGVDRHDWPFHREELNLHTIPKEFEPSPQAVADERNFYAGRCAGEAPYYGKWENTFSGRPIVLVSSSSTIPRGLDYFQVCIAALAPFEWHVILSIGEEIDAAHLMPLPPNFEVIRGVSNTQIYPYAALVIFGGGVTATAEAAYHGVPSIVTSVGLPELEGLGDNIESLGFGRHVKMDEMNATHLGKVAVEVTKNQRIYDNVARLMRSVRSAPGAEEAANRIEGYMDE